MSEMMQTAMHRRFVLNRRMVLAGAAGAAAAAVTITARTAVTVEINILI